MRMRGVTWPSGMGSSETTYLESLYNFYGATTTIKGSLHGSTPIVKRFSVENFQSRQNLAQKMAVFPESRGVIVKFLSSNPQKAHPCAEPRRLTYYAWKSVQASRL